MAELSGKDKALLLALSAGTGQDIRKMQDAVDERLQQIQRSTEDQANIAREQARFQQMEADAFRRMPEQLFWAIHNKEQIFTRCDCLLEDIETVTSSNARTIVGDLEEIRQFMATVSSIDSQYLQGMDQKQQTISLRSECDARVRTINNKLERLAAALNEAEILEGCTPICNLNQKQVREVQSDAKLLAGVTARMQEASEGAAQGCLLGLGTLLLVLAPILWLLTGGDYTSEFDRQSFNMAIRWLFLFPGLLLLGLGGGVAFLSRKKPNQDVQELGRLRRKWADILPIEQWQTSLPWLSCVRWDDGEWCVDEEFVEKRCPTVHNRLLLTTNSYAHPATSHVVSSSIPEAGLLLFLSATCPSCAATSAGECPKCRRMDSWNAQSVPISCRCGYQALGMACTQCGGWVPQENFQLVMPHWTDLTQEVLERHGRWEPMEELIRS